MTDRINRRYERPICPGDLEPLDNMLPAMREVVATRATAREIVESARAAVQDVCRGGDGNRTPSTPKSGCSKTHTTPYGTR
jgi:hypothetical protein